MTIGLILALSLSAIGLLYLLLHRSKEEGKVEEQNAILLNENNILSSAPITDADLINELRRKAANRAKDNSKP